MAEQTNKDRVKLSKDVSRHALKTMPAFFLTVLSLILTLIAWVSSGLSLIFGKITEGSFTGVRQLNERNRKL